MDEFERAKNRVYRLFIYIYIYKIKRLFSVSFVPLFETRYSELSVVSRTKAPLLNISFLASMVVDRIIIKR